MKRTELNFLNVGRFVKLTPQGKWYKVESIDPIARTATLRNSNPPKVVSLGTSVYYEPITSIEPADRLPRARQDHPGTRTMWNAPEPTS